MISRIRLAWWRESLEKIDRERAPAEPVLRGLSEHVLPNGISGTELAAMEEGWSALLSPEPLTTEDLQTYAAKRGALLFRFTARLLGTPDTPVGTAGACWALVDLARHSRNEQDARAAIGMALSEEVVFAWPPNLRPLGMLAILARRDAERGVDAWESPGAPRRMLRMLRHRLTGR